MSDSMKYGSTGSNDCYSGTDVLKNKLGMKDANILEEHETAITYIRQLELIQDPINGSFDLTHLQKIHRHIFRDIYDFAGKIRVVGLSKGTTPFCNPPYIEQNAEKLFNELQNENLSPGISKKALASRLAYYMSEINIIHPFREGNGRTIREFIHCLALHCGYELDWANVDADKLLTASINSVTNTDSLTQCIYKTLNKN